MGVDDVEPLVAVSGGAAPARRRRRRGPAGREREHLDFDDAGPPAAPATWSATKLPSAGPLGARVHVGDDQRAHGRSAASVSAAADCRAGAATHRSNSAASRVPLWHHRHAPAELPVAVFDSGVGGLTVLHELLVSLPTEDYLVPRRHRALPVRRAAARTSCGSSRSRSPSTCSNRARSCSSSRATRPARRRSRRSRSTWRRRPRGRRDRRGRARRRSSPSRAAAAAGSACSRRRRRSPAAPTSARCWPPIRTCTSRASPARTSRRSSRRASRSTSRSSRPSAPTARRCARPRSTP